MTMNSEVLIIGGGVIGLSVARELHRRGVRKITLLERGRIGREASFAAAGMLAPHAETNQADTFTKFCAESAALYEAFAAELFDETGVDVELDKNGTLYLAFNDQDVREIRHRFEWQKAANLAVEHWRAEEARRAEPFISPDVREALFFPHDWQVENRKLLAALQKYAALNSIEIAEQTEVKSLIVEHGKVLGAVGTDGRKFFAAETVLTAGAWTSLIAAENFTLPKIKPIRGQIIAYKTAKRLFHKVIYSPRGYLVPRGDGRILIGATVEDVGFDNRTTDAGTNFLRECGAEISAPLGNLEISEKWSGLRPAAADDLPVIGSFPQVENFLTATAHFRNGILLAPLTAKITAAKIVENRDSVYFNSFSPRRFQKLKAVR